MIKMTYIALGIVAGAALIAAIACSSCKSRGGDAAHDGTKADVPADIADCKLHRYQYSEFGTTRWPMHKEVVERCGDDTTKCVVYLFDLSKSEFFDGDGQAQMDTVVVGSEVLDQVKSLIIESQAWKFKERYEPKAEIMDGWSWSFSAFFDVSEADLAAAPAEKRARMKRHGGRTIASSGSNARPDTQLFSSVRSLLQQVITENADIAAHAPLE